MRDVTLQHPRPVSLSEVLDRLLDTGVVVLGEAKISVADIDLVYIGLKLVVTSIEHGRDRGLDLLPMRRRPPAEPDKFTLSQFAPPAGDSTVQTRRPLPARRLAKTEPTPPAGGALPQRVPRKDAARGLGQLVLTVIKLLHDLLERQALRRVDGGCLDPAQVERLGLTLMQQARAIEQLRTEFGLEPDDLNLDLGPLGKLV